MTQVLKYWCSLHFLCFFFFFFVFPKPKILKLHFPDDYSLNTAPFIIILYVIELCKLGEQGNINILIERHKIWVQSCKNIVQHCKCQNSLNTPPNEMMLYALELHNLEKQGDIKILMEKHKIWSKNCKNIVQHCRWHYSCGKTSIGKLPKLVRN